MGTDNHKEEAKQTKKRSKRVKPDRIPIYQTKRPQGITKKEFHEILDKASQPVKHEESDEEKSET